MRPVTAPDRAKQIENQLKSVIASVGLSATQLAELITQKCNRPESAQSFSQKLKRGSIKYAEVLEIAELLGFDIEWHKTRRE